MCRPEATVLGVPPPTGYIVIAVRSDEGTNTSPRSSTVNPAPFGVIVDAGPFPLDGKRTTPPEASSANSDCGLGVAAAPEGVYRTVTAGPAPRTPTARTANE